MVANKNRNNNFRCCQLFSSPHNTLPSPGRFPDHPYLPYLPGSSRPAHPGRLSSHLVEGFQRFRLMSFRQSPDSCYFVAWAFHLSVCLLSNAIVLFALELFIPCNINRVYLIVLAKTIAKRISSIISEYLKDMPQGQHGI